MPRYQGNSASPISVDPKSPSAVVDHTFDWRPRTNTTDINGTEWLGPSEVIASHVVTVGAGLTKDSSTQTNITVKDGKGSVISVADNTAVRVWLSGGTAGETYTVTCQITTDSTPARVEERSILVRVDQK